MICTANGIVALLIEYGDCRMTDLYLPDGPGGLFVMRTTAQPMTSPEPHIVVRHITHWFDEQRNYGVLITKSGHVEITEAGWTRIRQRNMGRQP